MEFARTVPHVLGKRNGPQPELRQAIVSFDVDVVGFDAVGREHEQPVRASSEKRRHRRPRDVRGRRAPKVSVGAHLALIAEPLELLAIPPRGIDKPLVKRAFGA
jgi:hypothetical protein